MFSETCSMLTAIRKSMTDSRIEVEIVVPGAQRPHPSGICKAGNWNFGNCLKGHSESRGANNPPLSRNPRFFVRLEASPVPEMFSARGALFGLGIRLAEIVRREIVHPS